MGESQTIWETKLESQEMRGFTPPLFLCIMDKTQFSMDRAVLKGLVRTLKALILELEAEVFADKEAYTKPRENYDDPIEYYNSTDDDDGYAD